MPPPVVPQGCRWPLARFPPSPFASPGPAAAQVLVKTVSIGVNPVDLIVRSGYYKPASFPKVRGAAQPTLGWPSCCRGCARVQAGRAGMGRLPAWAVHSWRQQPRSDPEVALVCLLPNFPALFGLQLWLAHKW